MERLIRAMAKFDASHTDGARLRCSRRHGHRFMVTVEKIATGDPADIEADLLALVSEWADRDLDEQLHAVGQSSVTAVAALVCERLLLAHPTITRVECSDGLITGIVAQEHRR